MAIDENSELANRRLEIRKQLMAQRAVIKEALEPTPATQFPRSKTMRFLTQNHGIINFVFKKSIATMAIAMFLKSRWAAKRR